MPVRHPGLRRALIRPAVAVTALTVAASGLLVTATPAAATDRLSTTLRVSPAPISRSVGSPVKFTWKLTRNGTPLAGRTVEMYRRPSTSTTWTHLGTHTTAADGTVAMAFKVAHSSFVYAKFLGTSKYAPSNAGSSVHALTIGERAITEAARHKGKPYQWGATGPDRFDCSGYTRYVWSRLGKSLPHNSGQQYGSVRHISKSSRKVGDLIFVYDSGGIYHVGIYAGSGYFWHSPHSGDVVKKSKIWSSSYYVGRVA
jgi:cell wall-associated NlpC family hydrolase